MNPAPRKSANDSYIDEIRDTGELNAALKKHLGFYRSVDVESYVNSLLDQIQNTETVYQDRSEEMRSSLLLITRERDEKIQRIKEMEEKLNDALDLPARLTEKGLVAIPRETYVQLDSDNKRLLQKNEELMLGVETHPDQSLVLEELHQAEAELETKAATISQLEQNLAAAQTRIAELQSLLDTAQQAIGDLTEARDRAVDKFATLSDEKRKISEVLQSSTKEKEELEIRLQTAEQRIESLVKELGDIEDQLGRKNGEVSKLELDLQEKRKLAVENQLLHDTLQLQIHGLTESLNQTRGKHQVLQSQYEIGQNMVARLMAEKTSLESEIKNRQQSWDIQRTAMMTRFQTVLSGQNQFLKQLQDSFDASVLYMQNLTETGMRNFMDEDETGQAGT